MIRRDILANAFVSFGTLIAATAARSEAADAQVPVALQTYNVTIRVFDPTAGLAHGIDYVLPVCSPDAEHAAASTLANAASFTTKTRGTATLPVAFYCMKIETPS